MARRPRWLAPLAIVATASLLLAACQPAAPGASPTGAGPTAAATSAGPFTAMRYPETGDAPCGVDPYSGIFKSIEATDRLTVVFNLCDPDVAFLSKVAFTSYAINDTAYLEKAATGGSTPAASPSPGAATATPQPASIVSAPNGTGPYKLREWRRGDQVILEANPDYWGDKAKAQTAVIRWSSEAAQRLVELQSGNVDGIDNVGAADFQTVQNDASLKLFPRPGLNTFYVGFNNTYKPFDNEKVRQAIAMGIDRKRIVDQHYPPGSEVATHFTPCAIPNGCTGEEWYGFDAAAAKQLLTEAGFPNGFETQIHLRDVVRGYLPEPTVVAQDIQAQLKANLNITASIDVQESTAYIDNADAGKLPGIHLLGWGADYPDATNFLDFHFGAGASKQFGNKFKDVTDALQEGARGKDDESRRPAYEKANNAIKQHVPMIPVAHGGSAVAFRADVEGAHSSPLGNESLAVMGGGADGQLVFMQNAEPPGLYCADESDGEALRVCEQISEALYAYEVGGTKPIPALAESCEPNADLTLWTCKLRDNVRFHDGATLDANDVVLSYAVQWDTKHPLHNGRDGSFTYFPGLWGGFLNPPPE